VPGRRRSLSTVLSGLGQLAGLLAVQVCDRPLETGIGALVAENASGDFIVWICPAGENAVVDCVEDSLTHALSAASNAMRDRTGHRCGGGCA
jgi:hypothetical protein